MTNAEATLRWKHRKLEEEGLCFNCNKRPAGGEGGTLTSCAICAEAKRQHSKARKARLAASRPPRVAIVKPKPVKVARARKPPTTELPKAKRRIRLYVSKTAEAPYEAGVDRMMVLSERLSALGKLRTA